MVWVGSALESEKNEELLWSEKCKGELRKTTTTSKKRTRKRGVSLFITQVSTCFFWKRWILVSNEWVICIPREIFQGWFFPFPSNHFDQTKKWTKISGPSMDHADHTGATWWSMDGRLVGSLDESLRLYELFVKQSDIERWIPKINAWTGYTFGSIKQKNWWPNQKPTNHHHGTEAQQTERLHHIYLLS